MPGMTAQNQNIHDGNNEIKKDATFGSSLEDTSKSTSKTGEEGNKALIKKLGKKIRLRKKKKREAKEKKTENRAKKALKTIR